MTVGLRASVQFDVAIRSVLRLTPPDLQDLVNGGTRQYVTLRDNGLVQGAVRHGRHTVLPVIVLSAHGARRRLISPKLSTIVSVAAIPSTPKGVALHLYLFTHPLEDTKKEDQTHEFRRMPDAARDTKPIQRKKA